MRSIVRCHEEPPTHQECLTDPGIDESVCKGAATLDEKLPGLIYCGTIRTVNLLAFPALFATGLEKVAGFLRHQFPMVRISESPSFIGVAHRGIDQGCYCRVHISYHTE